MNGSNLFKRATDPKQYDFPDIQWDLEVGLQSPHRFFFWEYLLPYKQHWIDKNVLDIGAGSGWLMHEIKKQGARSVTGIEPSESNITLAKNNFPDVDIIPSTLENFQSDRRFDVVIALLVFPHIADIQQAFEKIYNFSNENAELYIIIPNFEYYRLPRKDQQVEYEERSPDEYVAKIIRPFGTLADVARKDDLYIDAAQAAGFRLLEKVYMKPTVQLVEKVSRYALLQNQAITNLLRFGK